MVKWSWRNKAFEGQKQRGRQKVLNKAATIVLKTARYKIGDSTRKLTHSYQAKSRKGHEKQMFKIRGSGDGKKTPLLSLPIQVMLSSSQMFEEMQ